MIDSAYSRTRTQGGSLSPRSAIGVQDNSWQLMATAGLMMLGNSWQLYRGINRIPERIRMFQCLVKALLWQFRGYISTQTRKHTVTYGSSSRDVCRGLRLPINPPCLT
jgi:hypothetical protein